MPDVGELLSKEELAALRAAYSAADMATGARMAAEAPFPASRPLVEAIISTFYDSGGVLAADRREQALIAMMAAGGGQSRTFAVHLYWGLMEGLSPSDIAATLLLVGAYAGVDRYTNSLGVLFALASKVLRPALSSGGNALQSTPIVRAIAASLV